MTGSISKHYATPDRLAARQNLHRRYSRLDWYGWVAKRLALQPDARVLEIGCGTGAFWQAVLPRLPVGLELILTDASPGMVREARTVLDGSEARARVSCLVADAAALPFPDGAFDTALAMHMLYHLEAPMDGVRALRRVLRAGGHCCVATNGEGNMVELRALAARIFGPSVGGRGDQTGTLEAVEPLMHEAFANVACHRLSDVMTVTDQGDLVAYLMSMPQAEQAGPDVEAHVRRHVAAAMQDGGGTFRITKRLGVVEGWVPG